MDTTGTAPDDVAAIEQTARALLDDRMTVITSLASTKKRLKDAQDVVAEIEREYGSEFVAAQRMGWTDEELSRLGFAEPRRRPAGRPARSGGRRREARTRSTAKAAKTVETPPGNANLAAGNGGPAAGAENPS
ncbi:MAG: hypothetical protein ACRDP6_47005 [Actinoallomurus sp.]